MLLIYFLPTERLFVRFTTEENPLLNYLLVTCFLSFVSNMGQNVVFIKRLYSFDLSQILFSCDNTMFSMKQAQNEYLSKSLTDNDGLLCIFVRNSFTLETIMLCLFLFYML